MWLIIFPAVTQGMAASKFPTSPKEVATSLSECVQSALQGRQQRLQIMLPDGLRFNVEGRDQGQQMLGDPLARVKTTQRLRADRELAYLVLEMFQGYRDETACIFEDTKATKAAQREWAKLPLQPAAVRTELPRKGAGVGFGVAGGLGAAQPKVLIVCRPSNKTLEGLQPLSEELGTEGVVVLLNCEWCPMPGYELIYSLEENPHPEWEGGLLHYSFGGSWLLGAANNKGAPVVHGTSPARPAMNDIGLGFERIESDTNWFSNKGAAAALKRRAVAAAPATPSA